MRFRSFIAGVFLKFVIIIIMGCVVFIAYDYTRQFVADVKFDKAMKRIYATTKGQIILRGDTIKLKNK